MCAILELLGQARITSHQYQCKPQNLLKERSADGAKVPNGIFISKKKHRFCCQEYSSTPSKMRYPKCEKKSCSKASYFKVPILTFRQCILDLLGIPSPTSKHMAFLLLASQGSVCQLMDPRCFVRSQPAFDGSNQILLHGAAAPSTRSSSPRSPDPHDWMVAKGLAVLLTKKKVQEL